MERLVSNAFHEIAVLKTARGGDLPFFLKRARVMSRGEFGEPLDLRVVPDSEPDEPSVNPSLPDVISVYLPQDEFRGTTI